MIGLAARVQEAAESRGGHWRPCSGCYETEDGHPVGKYPYDMALKCNLGGGCSECGGLGAVWDNTDWDAFAAWSIERDKRSARPDSVERPTGWPRAATHNDLQPRWAGEFRDFDDWVNFAGARLTLERGKPHPVPAICVDTLGRRCSRGADFMRARDEGCFPVRYFWECE